MPVPLTPLTIPVEKPLGKQELGQDPQAQEPTRQPLCPETKCKGLLSCRRSRVPSVAGNLAWENLAKTFDFNASYWL
jgi:hypothetical protein